MRSFRWSLESQFDVNHEWDLIAPRYNVLKVEVVLEMDGLWPKEQGQIIQWILYHRVYTIYQIISFHTYLLVNFQLTLHFINAAAEPQYYLP